MADAVTILLKVHSVSRLDTVSDPLTPEFRISRRLMPIDPGRLLLAGVSGGPPVALQHLISGSELGRNMGSAC